MASTYSNSLRIELIATGEAAATWGDKTNVNLTNIAAAFGYATQDGFAANADSTTTVADGVADPARAMYFKVTSSATLTATRTLTIAPNTISRLMWIENATTGGQSIAISQGTGANVTIPTGKTAVVYLDGAGSGAAVVDAMAGVSSGASDTLAEILAAGNTTGGTDLAVSTGDDITFADSSKAIFGAGSDLQIYSDGTTGQVTGNVNVTGTVTADGITTSLGIDVNGTDDLRVRFLNGGSFKGGAQAVTTAGDMITGSAVDDVAIRSQSNMLFAAGGATERMRIDSSGNVSIGTDSGDAFNTHSKLRIQNNDHAYLQIKANSVKQAGILLGDTDDDFVGGMIYDNSDNSLRFNSGDAERMRIDASGNVGIGTSSPTTGIDLRGTSATAGNTIQIVGNSVSTLLLGQDADGGVIRGQGGNNALKFYTGGTGDSAANASGSERMRIDASGNLLVGRTQSGATGNGHSIRGGDSAVFSRDSTGESMIVGRNASAGDLVRFYCNGVDRGSINFDGGNTISYTTSSDQRLKENIADADDAGSKIDSIQVRKYDWKADGSHQDYGMIAQELQVVAPEAVSGDPDSDEMMGVDYSKLVPMMLKEIQSLRARVAQLES